MSAGTASGTEPEPEMGLVACATGLPSFNNVTEMWSLAGLSPLNSESDTFSVWPVRNVLGASATYPSTGVLTKGTGVMVGVAVGPMGEGVEMAETTGVGVAVAIEIGVGVGVDVGTGVLARLHASAASNTKTNASRTLTDKTPRMLTSSPQSTIKTQKTSGKFREGRATGVWLFGGARRGSCARGRRHRMEIRYILTDYVEQALAQAVYDKLDDGSIAGRIPACEGVVAFGSTLSACQEELRSTLEDGVLLGLKLGHSLPVIDGIDLNQGPKCEPGSW